MIAGTGQNSSKTHLVLNQPLFQIGEQRQVFFFFNFNHLFLCSYYFFVELDRVQHLLMKYINLDSAAGQRRICLVDSWMLFHRRVVKQTAKLKYPKG